MNGKETNLSQRLSEVSNQANKRTSSGRAVKRKRFDDEIIECGFKKDKHKITTSSSSALVTPTHQPACHANSLETLSSVNFSEYNPRLSESEVDLWTPEDHLKLIHAVLNTCDMKLVHTCTTFSHSFSVDELNERWRCLLRDKEVCKQHTQRLTHIHPGVVRHIQEHTPLNKLQENALLSIPFDSNPNLEVFSRLAEGNKGLLFGSARRLQWQWVVRREFERGSDFLKFYKMVARADMACGDDNDEGGDDGDEGGDDFGVGGGDSIHREELQCELNREMERMEDGEIKEIMRLEREVAAWTKASTQSDHTTHFDEHTYAIIKGDGIFYKMKTQQIVVGRKTNPKQQQSQQQLQTNQQQLSDQQPHQQQHHPQHHKQPHQQHHPQQHQQHHPQQHQQQDDVDIDLSDQVMSHKISRKHFTIRLLHHPAEKESKDSKCNQGNIEFVLTNLSRRPVMVNYKAVLLNQQCNLPNHSLIEISVMVKLSLHMHTDLLPTLTHPASSTTTISSSSSSAIFSN